MPSPTAEEQGYYVYGTQYVRLLHTRLNYFDANKECKKENGKLVAVRVGIWLIMKYVKVYVKSF